MRQARRSAAPRAAPGRQKPLEEEAVRRQAGDDESGEDGRGAGHRNDLDLLRQGLGHELEAGIGNQRRSGIRHEGQRRAAREPGEQMRPHDRGIVLVIGDERRRDAIMGEQGLGDPRVLRDDGVGRGERRQRPKRNVAEIADRRRDDVKPLADRLGFGPEPKGGEGARKPFSLSGTFAPGNSFPRGEDPLGKARPSRSNPPLLPALMMSNPRRKMLNSLSKHFIHRLNTSFYK